MKQEVADRIFAEWPDYARKILARFYGDSPEDEQDAMEEAGVARLAGFAAEPNREILDRAK